MKPKTEANSSEDVQQIERKLALKLKSMAYVFFFLSLAALLFAFFAPGKEERPKNSSILLDIEAISGAALFSGNERTPQEIFNFYAVSLLFFTIGIPLYYFSSKKTKLPNSEASSKMQLMPEEE